ncbi:hypothetical protein [Luteimonas sp. FCS-9]|uniref:hypothetical protein n=1 Tax=Luteimonas sp. FCS-9 TaxID=1547516 RepID=UPI00063E723B|nr:hypothetical protein [Luteimonas sp. FCS-9]KLJ02523.1 hypothetical protein WQ56_03100 [Luteimonas sp. FCS-9]
MPWIPLLLAAALGVTAEEPAPVDCSVDRDAMLALSIDAFDQDIDGGWRPLGEGRGCHLAAADLIAEYRRVHRPEGRNLLDWHEAQLRAKAGQTTEAIALMRRSIREVDGELTGWNAYVAGSIAFLERDRAALQAARETLSTVAPPPGLQSPAGAVTVQGPDGKPIEIPWPPNLDVLEAFERCFDASYQQAYESPRCRGQAP